MYIMKYDSKLINDYIMGNDIDGHLIEELENDIDFMREILVKTNDSKMYNMCSDRLKKDLEFTLFVIEHFINEKNFINDVIVNYFKMNNDNIKRKEFELSLASLSIKYNNDYLKRYQDLVANMYCLEVNEYQKVISRLDNKEWKKYYGMGFYFVIDRYGESEFVKDFFAQSMLDDIFVDYKLETEIHRKYPNQKDLEKYGINNYILEIVSSYDIHLKNYVAFKLELIQQISEKIKYYLQRWDMYNLNLADDVLHKIDRYFDNKENNNLLLREEITTYIVKKLNLQEIFNESEIYKDELKFANKLSKLHGDIDEESLPVPEMITLLDVENLIRKEVFGEEEIVEGNTKKLIRVNFGKNN